MDGSLVEVAVESVRVHMLSSQHVVLLKETGRDRYLPIWIGPWEANAIATRLQGAAPERPLTHDLFAATVEALGARISRVVISSLADETYHATLELEVDGRRVDVDARPSDSLALAVRAGAKIYVAEAVMDKAGVVPDAQVDEKLEVFREFINSLDMDLDEGHKGPPSASPPSGGPPPPSNGPPAAG